MENPQELNIVQIVQSIPKRLLRPFISDISSQNTRYVNFLSWLNGSWQLERLRSDRFEELGTLNEQMYRSRFRRWHASSIFDPDVVNEKVLAGFINGVFVLIDNVKFDNLKAIWAWVGSL
jgi:hypothetical protein